MTGAIEAKTPIRLHLSITFVFLWTRAKQNSFGLEKWNLLACSQTARTDYNIGVQEGGGERVICLQMMPPGTYCGCPPMLISVGEWPRADANVNHSGSNTLLYLSLCGDYRYAVRIVRGWHSGRSFGCLYIWKLAAFHYLTFIYLQVCKEASCLLEHRSIW